MIDDDEPILEKAIGCFYYPLVSSGFRPWVIYVRQTDHDWWVMLFIDTSSGQRLNGIPGSA